MGKKRSIVKEFQQYYNSLSEDARLIIKELILEGESGPKSSTPAPRAGKQSSSKKKSGLPAAQSSGAEAEKASVATGGLGGD